MMMGGDVECSVQMGTNTRKNHSTEYSTLPIQIPSHFTDIQMKSPQLLLKDSIRYLYATPRPRTPLHASDRSGPLYAIQSLFKDPVQTNLKHTQIRNHHQPCNETMKRVPSSRSHEYLEALKDERRKIQVFHRELPLCLELVDQVIESCRQQLCCSGRSDCEEQTQASGEGPVLEEFMPLKRSSSSECEEESNKCDEKLGKKVDWLRSVQLWNHSTDLPPLKEDSPRKNSVIEAKKNGGAFHPFRKEKSATTTPATTATTTTTITTATPTRITVPVAAASSTADNGNKSREDKGQPNKKSRRCWSPELHRRFLQALQQLGGSHAATPKQIREFMNVDGLTNDEVKSHLQKYRLHTRRPAPHLQNNSNNTQSPQFLVVGGIWVPPPEYAPSEGEAPQQCTKGIYVPVAAPPPQLTLSSCTQQQKQISESDGHNNSCSGSPTPTSSSMDTTTASPAF